MYILFCCPICQGTQVKQLEHDKEGRPLVYACPKCGDYIKMQPYDNETGCEPHQYWLSKS